MLHAQQNLFEDDSPVEGRQDRTEQIIELMADLKRFKVDITNALVYAHNSHSFDNIVDMVMCGRVHFYPLNRSFVIMEEIKYPNYSMYHTFLAGGELEDIMNAIPMLSQNARSLGHKYASMAGRAGWVKGLTKLGWQKSHVTMLTEL